MTIITHEQARSVPCSQCGAGVGEFCTTSTGKVAVSAHANRWDTVRRQIERLEKQENPMNDLDRMKVNFEELVELIGRDMSILKQDMTTLCENQKLLLAEIRYLRFNSLDDIKPLTGEKR